MTALAIPSTIPEITIHDGKAITTSVAVAEYFHKTHDNVLKKIRSVMEECDPSYRLVNFNETSYQRENPNGGSGISTAMFELTRDAFVLIVMGFTGKKALQWKIDYITAFNRMEAQLQTSPPAFPEPLIPGHYRILMDIRNGQVSYTHIADDELIFSVERLPDLILNEPGFFRSETLLPIMKSCMQKLENSMVKPGLSY